MSIWPKALILPALCLVSIYCVATLYRYHCENRNLEISHFSRLSEPVAQAVSLEFQGIISDLLMLKSLTYMGERIIRKEEISPEEWQMIYRTLTQVTNLDPRFLDPYLVAATTLPWEAGMVVETNALLEKAAKILTDDYRPNFFLWYNYFYFLNQPGKAAEYLEKAATIPGAPTYFSTLAARMNLYAGKIYAAVIFLQETMQQTTDPTLLKFQKKRLLALQKIGYLEQKIQQFKKKYHVAPKDLHELVDKGIIDQIPTDPYGGEFYIMSNGRVYTTSKLVPVKKEKKKE